MKISMSNLAWEPERDEEIAPILIGRGIHGVELALTKYVDDPALASRDEVALIIRRWSAWDLPVVALQSLLFGRPHLTVFGEDDGEALVQYLFAVFEMAEHIQVTRLVFGSPANRRRGDLPLGEAWSRALPLFRRLGDQATQHGVQLLIEPNPITYGCDFLTTAREVAAFVTDVDSPGIGVHLDTACIALGGERFKDAVIEAGALLGHVHASEPGLALLGSTGQIDHIAAAQVLRDAGYNGWVSVEMCPTSTSSALSDDLTTAASLAVSAYG